MAAATLNTKTPLITAASQKLNTGWTFYTAVTTSVNRRCLAGIVWAKNPAGQKDTNDMTLDELQIVADTAWITLGPDGFGVVVANEPLLDGFRVEVTGFEGSTMYHFSETVSRYKIEQRRGNTRYNYIRETVARIRKAITDLRTSQILQNLGE